MPNVRLPYQAGKGGNTIMERRRTSYQNRSIRDNLVIVRTVTIISTALAVLLSGCASSRPAPSAGVALSEGAPRTSVTIGCNVPNGVVRSLSGQAIGRCPLAFHIQWDSRNAGRWWAPAPDLVETVPGPGAHREFYLAGMVTAEGYETQRFRKHLVPRLISSAPDNGKIKL